MRQPKARRTPIRTCVACRSSGGKSDFVRVVRSAEGVVRIDPSGKATGRGAYLCRTMGCLSAAAKKKRLDRVLRTSVPQALYEELQRTIAEGERDSADGEAGATADGIGPDMER